MVKSMIAAGAIPHFHLCDELDMQALMAVRNQIKGDSVLEGVHLTFLPIMIKVKPWSLPLLVAMACVPFVEMCLGKRTGVVVFLQMPQVRCATVSMCGFCMVTWILEWSMMTVNQHAYKSSCQEGCCGHHWPNAGATQSQSQIAWAAWQLT